MLLACTISLSLDNRPIRMKKTRACGYATVVPCEGSQPSWMWNGLNSNYAALTSAWCFIHARVQKERLSTSECGLEEHRSHQGKKRRRLTLCELFEMCFFSPLSHLAAPLSQATGSELTCMSLKFIISIRD